MQGRGFCPECLGKTIVLSNSLGDNGGAVSHGRGAPKCWFIFFPHTVEGVRNNNTTLRGCESQGVEKNEQEVRGCGCWLCGGFSV